MQLPKEIETATMINWLSISTVWITSVGSENLYLSDQFGNEFYCKCYPVISIMPDDGPRIQL